MPGIARIGDIYGKGGLLIGHPSPDVFVNDRPVALTGCAYTPHWGCGPKGPQHCFGLVMASGTGVYINGSNPIVKGSKGLCQESVMTASSDVTAK